MTTPDPRRATVLVVAFALPQPVVGDDLARLTAFGNVAGRVVLLLASRCLTGRAPRLTE
ncbi:hypothetical protein [Streptomyces odontomachi]|uniref:hypothetical protein n=1 Tax=Streptomyces odontomachi TaxID=2944940 RepID=UPI00210F0A65|nr:hypothetical protein [Streptomyces sp. ODS25]